MVQHEPHAWIEAGNPESGHTLIGSDQRAGGFRRCNFQRLPKWVRPGCGKPRIDSRARQTPDRTGYCSLGGPERSQHCFSFT